MITGLAAVAFSGCLGTNGADDAEADGGAGAGGSAVDPSAMTAAHNRHRTLVEADPPLPDLVWDAQLAGVAQAWSDQLAAAGCELQHSQGEYGENLYWQIGMQVTADDVVASWYGEVRCYTFGAFDETDRCDATCIEAMSSSGCGHYTQVVWRDTVRLGCGVATCSSGAEIWTCNYDPSGNWIGEEPY